MLSDVLILKNVLATLFGCIFSQHSIYVNIPMEVTLELIKRKKKALAILSEFSDFSLAKRTDFLRLC